MSEIRFPDRFNIADYFLFDRLGEGLGEEVAVRYGERAYTYREVADRSEALARFLAEVGVPREHRVYVVLPDTPPFCWSVFGTLARGAVLAMGNPVSPAGDLEYVLGYTRAAALVTTPEVAASLAGAISRAPELRAVLLCPDAPTGEDPEGPVQAPDELSGALRGGGPRVLPLAEAVEAGRGLSTPRPETARDDVCVWLFTSGSTGRPKAAMHTHRDFAFNTEVYAKRTVGYRRGDVTVSVPRLYFGYATGTNLWFPLSVGATTCLFSERPTPETVTWAIETYRPTVVTNVPTMLGKLLDHDDRRRAEGGPGIDMSSVRFHLSAGEALPPSLLERFTSRYGCDVYDGIGSAEMFHIYASNRPGDVKPGSLGRAVEGYELKILPKDAEGPGAPEVPRGETGVLWVKGDSVALGYFQDRDKSFETFYGHWCRTGDLFRMDDRGYLWFSGRADDIFKVSGVFVAPLEVEECLMTHPAVALAAVIPKEDGGLTKPKAFVVLRDAVRERASGDGADGLAEELKEHVKSNLSKHKYPRWVDFVDDLPKNDRGKVNRKLLARREAGEGGAG